MADFKRVRTGITLDAPIRADRPDEQSVNQLILQQQGLRNIRSRLTGIAHTSEPALKVKNMSPGGGHVRVRDAADTKDLFNVFDSGVALSTPMTIDVTAGGYALTVRNRAAGGFGLRIVDSTGTVSLVTASDAQVGIGAPATIDVNSAASYGLRISNTGVGGLGLLVLNRAATEGRLTVTDTGTTVLANTATAYGLVVQNLGAGGFALQVLNSASSGNVLVVNDVGLTLIGIATVTGTATVTATNAGVYAVAIRNTAAGGLGLQVVNAAGSANLLVVNDAALAATVPASFTATSAVSYAARVQNLGAGGFGLQVVGSAGGNLLLVNDVGTTISAGNLAFGTTAQRITGDLTNATLASRLLAQTSTTNGASSWGVLPNGTGAAANLAAFNASAPGTATGIAVLEANATAVQVRADFTSGGGLPIEIYTANTKQASISTAGNLTIVGKLFTQNDVSVGFAGKSQVSVANGATVTVANNLNQGYLVLMDATSGNNVLLSLHGGAGTIGTAHNDAAATWNIGSLAGAVWNVTLSGLNWIVTNSSGAARTFYWARIGL